MIDLWHNAPERGATMTENVIQELEKTLNTWDDFVSEINNLNSRFGPYTEILYRGQADSKWGLETTLERDLSPWFLPQLLRL